MIWRALLLSLILATPVWAGGSRSYNGSTDNIDWGDLSLTTPLTFAAWVKSTDVTNIQSIISWADNTTTTNLVCEIRLRGDISDRIECACGEAVATVSQSTTSYTSGAWIHVACVFTNDIDTQIYINGVLEDSDSNASATFPSTANELDFGTRPESTEVFHLTGNIAHAKVYTKALSDIEINSIIRRPELTPDSCVIYSPSFGNDSPEINLCGVATGTLGGTTVSTDGPPIMMGVGSQ